MDQQLILRHVALRRTFIFLDEWAFYIILAWLYKKRYPFWILIPVLLFGTGALITSYKNLDIVEEPLLRDRSRRTWLYWPFA